MAGDAEIVILGAGICGAALAYELARRSVGRVVLYDPGPLASGTTGRSAGIVTEQLWDPWDVELVRASKALYQSLGAREDPPPYEVNGFVRWASGPAEADALETAARRWANFGVEVRPLGPSELARQLPGGRFDDVRAAFGTPGDAVVTPSAMTQLLADGARRAGAELVLGEPFRALRPRPAGWELATAGRTLTGRTAVVAAGAWTRSILGSVGHPLPLAPYRTQAAVLRATPPAELGPSVHDLDVDVYARPEGPGRLLAGDGTELVESDPRTARTDADPAFLARVGEALERRLPAWAGSELAGAWAGLCTATPDRRPVAGPLPGTDGLWVLAGFNGFGVMRAGGIARRVAEAIASAAPGGPAMTAIAPVDPGRFHGSTGPFPIHPGFTLEPGPAPRY